VLESTPFRFGVSVRRAENRAEWQDKARRAEALGYSTFLTPDHLVDILPPLVPLVSAAEATEKLRVGTFVLNNDFRHPVIVARESAAVDLLTDGRFELGLGSGHMQSEYDEIGLRFDPGRVRVERLRESVAIIKKLLAGEEVTFSGTHHTVTRHRIHPRPVQTPRPPLLIGGNSRRLLTLAAREADIVSFLGFSHLQGGRDFDFSAFTDSGTEERVAVVREAADSRFGTLELNAVVQRVVIAGGSGSSRRAVEEFARDSPLSTEDVLGSPYVLIGSVDAIADAIHEKRERHGFSYWVVPEHSMEAFAPVVSRLSGV
jgi:probable F420-dependent oxidoreductase